MSHPFINSHYFLNSCQLCPITSESARALAQNLVQMQPWQTLGYSTETLKNYLLRSDPALYRFVITVSEQVVGTVGVRYPWLRGAYLELLAVYPSQQGQGIGRIVINWLAEELRSTSSRNLWTLVSSFNTPAQDFYQRLGFITIGQLDDFIVPGYGEIFLRKVL